MHGLLIISPSLAPLISYLCSPLSIRILRSIVLQQQQFVALPKCLTIDLTFHHEQSEGLDAFRFSLNNIVLVGNGVKYKYRKKSC